MIVAEAAAAAAVAAAAAARSAAAAASASSALRCSMRSWVARICSSSYMRVVVAGRAGGGGLRWGLTACGVWSGEGMTRGRAYGRGEGNGWHLETEIRLDRG